MLEEFIVLDDPFLPMVLEQARQFIVFEYQNALEQLFSARHLRPLQNARQRRLLVLPERDMLRAYFVEPYSEWLVGRNDYPNRKVLINRPTTDSEPLAAVRRHLLVTPNTTSGRRRIG